MKLNNKREKHHYLTHKTWNKPRMEIVLGARIYLRVLDLGTNYHYSKQISWYYMQEYNPDKTRHTLSEALEYVVILLRMGRALQCK